jgi:hypothetical protein
VPETTRKKIRWATKRRKGKSRQWKTRWITVTRRGKPTKSAGGDKADKGGKKA